MEPRKKLTAGRNAVSSRGEKAKPVGIKGVRAYRALAQINRVMNTFRKEPSLSLTIPQKETETIPTPELMAFRSPSWEAENPISCKYTV